MLDGFLTMILFSYSRLNVRGLLNQLESICLRLYIAMFWNCFRKSYVEIYVYIACSFDQMWKYAKLMSVGYRLFHLTRILFKCYITLGLSGYLRFGMCLVIIGFHFYMFFDLVDANIHCSYIWYLMWAQSFVLLEYGCISIQVQIYCETDNVGPNA